MKHSKIKMNGDYSVQELANILRENIAEYFARELETPLTSPEIAKEFLEAQMPFHESEVFGVMFLDNRHYLIEYREMFNGTIDGASVHPREIVKASLETNASAVILAHNHPSGTPEPSEADIRLTQRLKESLNLVDVRVLDHFVIGKGSVSMSQRGLF